jgi:hypothetical protein
MHLSLALDATRHRLTGSGGYSRVASSSSRFAAGMASLFGASRASSMCGGEGLVDPAQMVLGCVTDPFVWMPGQGLDVGAVVGLPNLRRSAHMACRAAGGSPRAVQEDLAGVLCLDAPEYPDERGRGVAEPIVGGGLHEGVVLVLPDDVGRISATAHWQTGGAAGLGELSGSGVRSRFLGRDGSLAGIVVWRAGVA